MTHQTRMKWARFRDEELLALRSAIRAARGEREGGEVETQLLSELDELLQPGDQRLEKEAVR